MRHVSLSVYRVLPMLSVLGHFLVCSSRWSHFKSVVLSSRSTLKRHVHLPSFFPSRRLYFLFFCVHARLSPLLCHLFHDSLSHFLLLSPSFPTLVFFLPILVFFLFFAPSLSFTTFLFVLLPSSPPPFLYYLSSLHPPSPSFPFTFPSTSSRFSPFPSTSDIHPSFPPSFPK